MVTILVVYVRAKVIVIGINATFNNISVAVSFVCGGNQNIRRKPPTCRKSRQTLSHNVVSNTSQ